MSYLVLARKYRPRTFGEVVGQEVARRTLQGAIEEGRIGHAYLFAGPRGTGKTTTARILAKALICERGPAPEPCGECTQCLDAERGANPDVIEFDAASNTGVDDVRELREQVAFAPMRARFKVYIVDEVHMLSVSAFNAFLKTLEEPPAHVKFLFATTELHKVPATVQSRCQIVKLTLLSEEQIAEALERVLASEEAAAEEGVSRGLARAARGSMRDALSLTDQLLSLVGRAPSAADVERLGGTGVGGADVLLDRVEEGDAAAILAALAAHEGREDQVLSELLERLRLAMLAAVVPDRADLAGLAPGEREALTARAKRIGADRVALWLEELLAVRERMERLSVHAGLILEVALLDLARPETTLPLAEIEVRLAGLEARLGAAEAPGKAPRTAPSNPGRAPSPPAAPAAPPPDPGPSPEPATRPEAGAARTPGGRGAARSSIEAWKSFLAALGATHSSLADLLDRRGRLVEYRPGVARVQLARLSEVDRRIVLDAGNQRTCAAVFSEVAGETMEVTLEDTAGRPSGREDAFTRQVVDLFGGQVEDER